MKLRQKNQIEEQIQIKEETIFQGGNKLKNKLGEQIKNLEQSRIASTDKTGIKYSLACQKSELDNSPIVKSRTKHVPSFQIKVDIFGHHTESELFALETKLRAH